MMIPLLSERDKVRDQLSRKLRERVLTLLAHDRGVAQPVIEEKEPSVEKKDLDAQKEARLKRLAEILEQKAQKPEPKPANVRNYAMACKPQGVRLASENGLFWERIHEKKLKTIYNGKSGC